MHKKQLLITNDFHAPTIEKLDRLYDTHKLWQLNPEQKQQLIAQLGSSCVAVASASWACDELVYQLPALKIISCFGVGVDGIDFSRTAALGIKVSNTPDVLNDAVADIALALMLNTSRNLINADKFVRTKQWPQGPFAFSSSLAGKTLGIIGLGRIGEEIAQRAVAFKMHIAYHNRNDKLSKYTYYENLGKLAQHSDILICMLPGGDATRHIIDAGIFEKLGPEGIFINVGRGTAVDEAALIDALKRQKIAAAGLDVYAQEPHVAQQLLDMENVVLLPHVGSATVETRDAMGQLVIDNLKAFFNAEALITEVV